jgi:hypothetical protein
LPWMATLLDYLLEYRCSLQIVMAKKPSTKKARKLVGPNSQIKTSFPSHIAMVIGKVGLLGVVGVALVGLGFNYYSQTGISNADASTGTPSPTMYYWVNADTGADTNTGAKTKPFKTIEYAIKTVNGLVSSTQSKETRVKIYLAAATNNYSLCDMPSPVKNAPKGPFGYVFKNNVELLGSIPVGSNLRPNLRCNIKVEGSGFRIDNVDLWDGSIILRQGDGNPDGQITRQNASISRVRFYNGYEKSFVVAENIKNVTIRDSIFQSSGVAPQKAPLSRTAILLDSVQNVKIANNKGSRFGSLTPSSNYPDIFVSCGFGVTDVYARNNKITGNYTKYDNPETCKGKLLDTAN